MGDSDMLTSKISVWWDIENCSVPENVDPHYIAQNVSSALHHASLKGPVTIDVFGDTKSLERTTLEALSSTGVTLNHVPKGNKDAADKAILVAMLFWALDNPPPAHFLLISGDGDFANALHRLRMKKYNVLLARPEKHVKPALLGAATSVWYWKSVAKGQLSASEPPERSEEPFFLRRPLSDRSTEEQLTSNNGFHRRSGSTPSQRPNGLTSSPIATSRSLSNNQDLSFPRYNEGSFLSSLQRPFESAVTVSGVVENRFSRADNDLNLENMHLPGERKQTTQPGSSTGLGAAMGVERRHESFVEGNSYANPLDARMWPISSMESAAAKAHLDLEADTNPNFPSNVASSGSAKKSSNFANGVGFRHVHQNAQIQSNSIAARPPNPGKVQLCGPMEMRPPFPARLQPGLPRPSFIADERPTFLSDANSNSVSNPRPASLPFPRFEKPANSAHDISDLHRSFLNIVKKAMKILNQDGLMPSEANLQDCIQYWEKQLENFNLRQTLDRAVELHEVTLIVGAAGSRMFLPLNTKPWDYVEIGDMLYEYPKELWMDFCQFLLCTEERQTFVKSQSQYDAAQILKNSGPNQVRGLSLGHIIHILQQAIHQKQWLRPHRSGWVPLSINLPPVSGYFVSQNGGSNLGPGQIQSGFVHNGKAQIAGMSNPKQATSSPVSKDLSRRHFIFEKLRVWLVETLQVKAGYDISLVRKDFEQATGIHLDHEEFGFPKFQDLIQVFSDIVRIEQVRKGLLLLYPTGRESKPKFVSSVNAAAVKGPSTTSQAHHLAHVSTSKEVPGTGASKDRQPATNLSVQALPDKHAILEKLRVWLIQTLKVKSGYDISLVRKDFQQATGIYLDHQLLGYAKLQDVIQEFPDVVHIEKPRKGLLLLYPAKKNGISETFPSVSAAAVTGQRTVYRPLCLDDNSEGKTSVETVDTENTSKHVLEKLRSWLTYVMVDEQDGYDITKIRDDFLLASGIDLDKHDLGFNKIKDFLTQSSDIIWLDSSPAGLCLAFPAKKKAAESPELREKMLKDTEVLLLEMVTKCRDGYPLARLKLDFQQQFGYELNQSLAGFSKLGDFVGSLNFVSVETAPQGPHKMVHLKVPQVDIHVRKKE